MIPYELINLRTFFYALLIWREIKNFNTLSLDWYIKSYSLLLFCRASSTQNEKEEVKVARLRIRAAVLYFLFSPATLILPYRSPPLSLSCARAFDFCSPKKADVSPGNDRISSRSFSLSFDPTPGGVFLDAVRRFESPSSFLSLSCSCSLSLTRQRIFLFVVVLLPVFVSSLEKRRWFVSFFLSPFFLKKKNNPALDSTHLERERKRKRKYKGEGVRGGTGRLIFWRGPTAITSITIYMVLGSILFFLARTHGVICFYGKNGINEERVEIFAANPLLLERLFLRK